MSAQNMKRRMPAKGTFLNPISLDTKALEKAEKIDIRTVAGVGTYWKVTSTGSIVVDDNSGTPDTSGTYFGISSLKSEWEKYQEALIDGNTLGIVMALAPFREAIDIALARITKKEIL